MPITQSTSYRAMIFMADATDDESPEPGLSPVVYISKNGAAFTTTTNSVVEVPGAGRGWYYIILTSSETDTVGEIALEAEASGADIYRTIYQVEAAPTVNVSLTAAQMRSIADHVLRRSLASAETSGDGDSLSQHSLLGGILKLASRTRVNGATNELVVYRANEATELYRQALTADASADPIVEVH